MKDSITLRLNGKKRSLRYDIDSYNEASKKLKISWKNAEGVMQKLKGKETDVKNLSVLLWAGLIWEDSKLTVADVEEKLKRFENKPRVLKRLARAVEKALEKLDEEICMASQKLDVFNQKIQEVDEKLEEMKKEYNIKDKPGLTTIKKRIKK